VNNQDNPSGSIEGALRAPHLMGASSEIIMETMRPFFSQQILVILIAAGVFGGLGYLWLRDQMRALEAKAVRVRANTRVNTGARR
jgi:hypothetical protein